MLVFPNCKINLGLHVTSKRPDGFHNIETVFYPLNWCDALEVIENNQANRAISLSQSGLPVSGPVEGNLLFKAWNLVNNIQKLPPLKMHLHKHIPMGAGLGGGSADAAFCINLLDRKFNIGLSLWQKLKMASEIGSDCAFFIENKPVMATGKGNEFSSIQANLSGYYILAVYPGVHSNTRDAYNGLAPKMPAENLRHVIENIPVQQWKHHLVNDFEASIFAKYPAVGGLKQTLYNSGAIYASMSGSGSAVFGIFDKEPPINFPASFQYFLQKPASVIL